MYLIFYTLAIVYLVFFYLNTNFHNIVITILNIYNVQEIKFKLKKWKTKPRLNQSQNKLSQSAKPALSEEELDDIISDITLKRGRNAYTIYITEMYQKEKAQNDKIKLMDVSKKYSSKWAKVSDKDKDTYEKKSQEEKEKIQKRSWNSEALSLFIYQRRRHCL